MRSPRPAATGSGGAGTTPRSWSSRRTVSPSRGCAWRASSSTPTTRTSRSSWSTTGRPTGRASTWPRSPSATRAWSCCATRRIGASGRRSTRASRRPTATCSSSSTTTRSFRPGGCRASRPISTVPRSGSSARPRTGAATRPRSMPRTAPMVKWSSCQRGEQSSTRASPSTSRWRRCSARRCAATSSSRSASSTSASRSVSSRTTTTPSGCAQPGYRVVCAEDAFVHHFGEASFGELVPTGRYGELFRANKARFEEKWGVTWQPHLRRPNAWYRDLVERIRAVVDQRAAAGRDRAGRLERRRRAAAARREAPRLALPADGGRHVRRLPPWRQRGGDRALRGAPRERAPSTSSFPETALWWLDYYGDFIDMLRRGYHETVWRAGTCVIFGLRSARPGETGSLQMARTGES